MRSSLLPIARPGHVTPKAWRVSAVRLAFRVGVKKAAYIFGVAPGTVWRWHQQMRQKA